MCDAPLFGPQFDACQDRHTTVGDLTCDTSIAAMAQRVARLALLDTNPFPETADRSVQRIEIMRAVAHEGLKQVVIDSLKPAYLADANREDRTLLEDICVPTLVLCGREDALCPLALYEMMAAAIPEATLVVVDSAGHLPTLERPLAVNAALRRWLEN